MRERVGRSSESVSVFRADSRYSNGNTRDREGRLVSCEHGARRVTRTEYDGTITVTARRREESLQNVPIAISAYSGDQLELEGALDITDIGDTTPNVTIDV